jgi:hypothetical protein
LQSVDILHRQAHQADQFASVHSPSVESMQPAIFPMCSP